MMRLESDFIDLILATMEGSLSYEKVRWSDEVALGVVMAAGGYPIKYSSGIKLSVIAINHKMLKCFMPEHLLKITKL